MSTPVYMRTKNQHCGSRRETELATATCSCINTQDVSCCANSSCPGARAGQTVPAMVPGAGLDGAARADALNSCPACGLCKACQVAAQPGTPLCNACPHNTASNLHAHRAQHEGAAQVLHPSHLRSLGCDAGTDAVEV